MIEQILTTDVGRFGFLGFLAVALVGFFLLFWIKKEIDKDVEQD